MKADPFITAKEAETFAVPDHYEYTYDDFLSEAPYEKLYSYFGNEFAMNREVLKMANNANSVKFRGFRTQWKLYLEAKDRERKQQTAIVPNQTEFDGQMIELECGNWESSDFGICRVNKFGAREMACSHPIMPVGRLVNIDTGEVKLRIAYKRPGRDKKWQTTIISKEAVADSKQLNKHMSAIGVSINQKSAPILMEYLTDIEDRNYDLIPESKSIGRLGYIEGEGFSPYVENLVFDGDAAYRSLYGYIKSGGSQTAWFETALECRKMSTTARIFLAASFASPLLSIVGALPFFVHCWGGSGTGKTVALMLAASVWGDPLKGRFVQTFNATRVGQELTAAFLNQLPMCIDELQLTKGNKGQSNFDVYQLAEGVGRTRGKKTGGVETTPTWDCCFLTTGEDPVIGNSAGGGAVNRVIEIECQPDKMVINDAPRIANGLKKNFGWAGKDFVERLYRDDGGKTIGQIRAVYQNFLAELNQNDTTEKQALAAAAILTADLCATEWIFRDDMCLDVDEIKTFLASKESVSAGGRAYSWICNWVAENENHFYTDSTVPAVNVYGKIEDNMAYINNNVLTQALNDNGFNPTATYSYLKARNLIEPGKGRGFGGSKKIGRTNTYCIFLKLPSDDENCDEIDELPL